MVLKVREHPPEHRLKAQKLVRRLTPSTDNSALYAAATKQISVSVPLRFLAQVEALASHAGESRGSMVVTLIDIALALTFEEMPPEVVAEVSKAVSQRETELYNEFDPQEAA